MNDAYLDTSWTLYHNPSPSPGFKNIFATTPSQDRLNTYSSQLKSSFFASHSSHAKDDFDDEDEKLGALKDCRWSSISHPSSNGAQSAAQPLTNQGSCSHSIEIIYQKQSYKFILYSAYLVLAKSSAPCQKRFLTFLSDRFNVASLETLKFDPEFLQDTLMNYITTLSQYSHELTDDNNDDNDNNDTDDSELQTSTRLSILKTALSNLKLTISFLGPVAPNLKTIDLDVPHETVNTLLTLPPEVKPPQPQQQRKTQPTISNHAHRTPEQSFSNAGRTFLQNLSHHITEQTGLKLPLLSTNKGEDDVNNNTDNTTAAAAVAVNSPNSDADQIEAIKPMKLSRITTAFWVFSVEGKIKFSSRVLNGVGGGDGRSRSDWSPEDMIRSAGAEILDAIDDEARSRR